MPAIPLSVERWNALTLRHHPFLNSSKPGFCAVTNAGQGEHCKKSDEMGAWEISTGLDACLERCHKCKRCHFVSYSRAASDCSWFRDCSKLSAGHGITGYNPSHATFNLRHENGRLRPEARAYVETAAAVAASRVARAKARAARDIVCFGRACVSWDKVALDGRSWLHNLPPPPELNGGSTCTLPPRAECSDEATPTWRRQRFCPTCEDIPEIGSSMHRPTRPTARFDLTRTWHRMPADDRVRQALGFARTGNGTRAGWLPTLLQSIYASPPPDVPAAIELLRCTSTSRGEDSAILRSFFVTADGLGVVRAAADGTPPTFLELGGLDGMTESTTWLYERCLGWRGLLIEAQPTNFAALLTNRPATLNLNVAVCEKPGTVRFAALGDGLINAGAHSLDAKHGRTGHHAGQTAKRHVLVQCAPLREYLGRLRVEFVDFLSLDIEGEELTAITSLFGDTPGGSGAADGPPRPALSVGVLMVEVRPDGQRASLLTALLAHGFRYVGQIHGWPGYTTEILSDVFVNATHMHTRFPHSRAASMLPRAVGSSEIMR